jgi:hypothetical protein
MAREELSLRKYTHKREEKKQTSGVRFDVFTALKMSMLSF